MFEFVGNVVQGGWDALDNIASGIGKGASYFVSPFFPTPQKTTIKSDIVQPAGGAGNTYRPTSPDAPSFAETAKWAANEWLNSPYELQYSIPAKRSEGASLASNISKTKTSGIGGLLSDIYTQAKGFLQQAGEIRTLADDFYTIFRSPISSGPVEIGNSPGSVRNTNPPTTAGANVFGAIKGIGAALLNQVKGLFNLGYQQPAGAQPAFGIKHEITPSAGLSTGLIIAGVVIALIILLSKKK